LEFLGLPWDERVLKFYEHARKNGPLTYLQGRDAAGLPALRWTLAALLQAPEPILETLQPFVKEFGYSVSRLKRLVSHFCLVASLLAGSGMIACVAAQTI
jgi:hypothetical protein